MAISSASSAVLRLLAAEHEQDLPDHGDPADGEQRLGDEVAFTPAANCLRAAVD
jgi:hypothetical protein